MTSLTFLLLLLLLTLLSVTSTDIKFTPGDNSGEAARAPRSQKYWDAHNIKKPEYAKTDAEVWAEKLATLSDFFSDFLSPKLLIGCIGLFCVVGYERYKSNNKGRLGGDSTGVDERGARLKRFEMNDEMNDDSEPKSYSEIMKDLKENKVD
ncbi:hypothetical protein TL16_g11233 [Triparma laevis f. inornata]|uniref:Uncharacterized protein n=2 Tax=Triparma laevis TaxID=1534972 RepID=A0A9W7FG99_9STRA|nr:hypothetical protein TL16_g11233 [Triparma laevis f. inornata]GMI11566.1 hypothetical protein TrLO_g7497 [Triparma laevis f. longispina]